MQLSRLQIKGFKSFGDKVIIEFDKGVTGVVGPNGSGKSNIVDAIRWVLGEQKTSSLRSDKMENVIFNGTKNRKPTNLAEVSLTFENTKNILSPEYSQVTITRKYYRTGESEYELNGIPCRLKDITNLFLDTGIASNSYAIIELKMVDDLLNDKNNSRRGLFEEAAGISKYKLRKKESLKKLSDSELDIARVNDIIFEVEKNLKNVEKQAQEVQVFLQLKEEYKNYSILFTKKKITSYQIVFVELSQKKQKEEDLRVSLQKQHLEKEAYLEKNQNETILHEKTLNEKQKQLNEYGNTIRQYESEKKIKNEKIQYLKQKNEILQKQIQADTHIIENDTLALENLTKEKNTYQKLLAEQTLLLETKIEELEALKKKQDTLQNKIHEKNTQAKRNTQKLYELQKEIEVKQSQITGIQTEMEATIFETHTKKELIHTLQDDVQHASKQKELYINTIQTLKKEETERDEQIEKLTDEINNFSKEIDTLKRKRELLQNETMLTKSFLENMGSGSQSIKFLKKKYPRKQIPPFVADIITCPDLYKPALESFIEPYTHYLIVDDITEAKECIQLLADSSQGKAYFFILQNIQNTTAEPPQHIPNAIHLLSIIQYKKKYQKLIELLFANVYITPAPPKNENYNFITQDGKYIKYNHIMYGGSIGIFDGNTIGKRQDIENLEQEILTLQQKIQEIETQSFPKKEALETLKKLSRREEIIQNEKNLQKITSDELTLSLKKDQWTQNILQNETKQKELSLKKQKYQEEITALLLLHKDLETISQEQEDILQAENDSLAEIKKQVNKANEEAQNQKILTLQQQNKIESTEQEMQYRQKNINANTKRIENYQEEIAKNHEDIEIATNTLEINEEHLVKMYETKVFFEKELQEKEREYFSLREMVNELEKEIRSLQRKTENSNQTLADLENKIAQNTIQINALNEGIFHKFQISIETTEIPEDFPNATKDMSETELESKVEEVKRKIDALGPINYTALETFQEIKLRYDFLIRERTDLSNAKESLLQTIQEIELTAKTLFLEAFHKIRENFLKVFRSLFTEEDICELTLLNPDDILESPIEITAKPKGKRPLSINQLSGGEKTLTAISLLFAIYLLKPAPFCIFDEVDAPLDDANIDKFNKIIRTFSEQSQFIIITHNKKTMAKVDIIYGITMIEMGISHIVPIDIRNLE